MTGKRWFLAGVLGLAGLCATAPVGAAAAPTSTQLEKPICHRALLPAARKIAVTAVMRPVNGTTSMAMMFDLQRARRWGGPFVSVRGHGLDQWIHPPNPTLGQRPGDIWKFEQKVENLPGPAYYRFRVRFRWTGAHGKTLATSTQTGPTCRQPELRPDLLARSLTIKPLAGAPTENRYIAQIANRGLTAAGSFDVELVVSGKPPQTMTVSGLGPRSSTRQTFSAPACTPGSRVTVIVDPTAEVLDYDRANNTLAVECPAPTQTRRYTR
jgi:hypothetical protein